jgi:oligoendopeptidase F
MKPPVWRDDHIYAAPDDPAIDAAFQEAARALTRLDALWRTCRIPPIPLRMPMPCATCCGPSAARPTG